MAKNLGDVEALIALMARLPGLGPLSARRAVLHLISRQTQLMDPLAALMQTVSQTIRKCTICGNLSEQAQCHICSDRARLTGQICVVESVSDLWAMERASVFKGRYHVLGGTLSALDNIGPENLSIPMLIERLEKESATEIILALGATIEGQTTAHYIAEHIRQMEYRLEISSLAQGVPIGGSLEFLDDGTINAAISARKTMSA